MKFKVNNVEFGYSDVPVLRDIMLNIEGAQLVSILGPNGVGKSTLIHCMNNILKPTQGVVTLNGTNVKSFKLKELAKVMGYVPYSSSDSFPMTVADTVLMGRHPHSSWKCTDEDLDIVYETLNMLDIEDLAMRPFNELSAGQHQKVMLARGFVQQPKILLLDEPTSNLDIRHQMEVTMILREMAIKKGILVIMISHDINIASKYSDKIIIMSEGKIFATGTPKEVITEENVRRVYGVDSKVIDDDGRPHVILSSPTGGYKTIGEKNDETIIAEASKGYTRSIAIQ